MKTAFIYIGGFIGMFFMVFIVFGILSWIYYEISPPPISQWAWDGSQVDIQNGTWIGE